MGSTYGKRTDNGRLMKEAEKKHDVRVATWNVRGLKSSWREAEQVRKTLRANIFVVHAGKMAARNDNKKRTRG